MSFISQVLPVKGRHGLRQSALLTLVLNPFSSCHYPHVQQAEGVRERGMQAETGGEVTSDQEIATLRNSCKYKFELLDCVMSLRLRLRFRFLNIQYLGFFCCAVLHTAIDL